MGADTKTLDVLAVVDEAAFRASLGADKTDYNKLVAARAAIAELVEAGKKLLPRNVTLANTNVPDSYEIELVATLGELRAFDAALRAVGGGE